MLKLEFIGFAFSSPFPPNTKKSLIYACPGLLWKSYDHYSLNSIEGNRFLVNFF